MQRFPFGRPITPRPPSAQTSRPLFVLGAYPSAVHVEWRPPSPFRRITAIAVDNEPTPFWDGVNQHWVVERWKAEVGFRSDWGRVTANPKFNGPCGVKVVENILAPLGFSAGQAWITDCLDTYRSSVGGAKRVADTYAPWASTIGLPQAELSPHPSENEIAREAIHSHRARLLRELDAAAPDVVVTLGNAALRVLCAIASGTSELRKLSLRDYGQPHHLRLGGRKVTWFPLAHPAAPAVYQAAHARWRRVLAEGKVDELRPERDLRSQDGL